MSQTSFGAMPALVAGHVVNCNQTDISNRPAAEDLPFGRLIVKDSGEFKLGNVDPVGITISSLQKALGEHQYAAADALGANVLRKGYVAVEVVDGCSEGGEVWAAVDGTFRGTTDTGFTKQSGLIFETACAAGGLASVRVDL